MSDVRLFLGVDGGGSKTAAVIVDSMGSEVGRGSSGSGNYAAVGLESAVRNITEAVQQARAAVPGISLTSAWIGLAGVDRPADMEILSPHLSKLASGMKLTNDAELALSPLPGVVGVAVVVGTGAIAVGRNSQGKTARAGGWGHIIGDEGSGYDLGCRALQAVIRAYDGRGRRTSLTERVLERWELSDPTGIIGRVYPDTDKAEIARLSSLVFSEARAGDEIAREMVEDAATEICLSIEAVARHLDLPSENLALSFIGGLVLYEEDFRERILKHVGRTYTVSKVELVHDPALSAAMALAALNGKADTL